MESIISPRQPPKVAAVQARRKVWMPFTRGEHGGTMPAPSTSLFFSGNIARASGLNRDRRVKITDAHQGSRTWNAMSIPSTGTFYNQLPTDKRMAGDG